MFHNSIFISQPTRFKLVSLYLFTMMKFLSVVVVIVVCFISVTSSYKIQRIYGYRGLSLLHSNKLDGIVIPGDLTPIANNLLIKVKEAAVSTAGGLYIPDNAKERPTEGLVMAAGPGRIHPETGLQLICAVKQGESVIYGKYDGTEMKYNDANHQLIKDDDVLLKYTGSEPTFANCQPVKDQVMIRLPGKEAAAASGIILGSLDSKDKKVDCGVVAKIGPGRQAGNGAIMPIQV